jgi:hypothetical protein
MRMMRPDQPCAERWPWLGKLTGLLLAFLLLIPGGELLAADGLFVAVGYGGRRASSADGITWQHEQRWSDEAKDDDNVLFNVAYGLGRFIAVGGGAKIGHILSTRDGQEWRELPRVRGRVATIAFGRERFVAGHDAELLWSDDGETFRPGEKLPVKGSVHARRSACGDTEAGFAFVIIGDVDLYAEKKRVNWRGVTGNGEKWTWHAIETTPARDIAYGSGHFVVVGPDGLIESSHDGQTWKRHEVGVSEDFSRVVWTGSRFLVSGGKVAWSSADALTWKREGSAISGSIAWAREQPRPLGISFSWGGNIWRSDDLARWKKIPISPGPSFNAVAFGPQ